MNPKEQQAFLETFLKTANIDFTSANTLPKLNKLAKDNGWDGVFPKSTTVLKKIDWSALGQTNNRRERTHFEKGIIQSIIVHPTQPVQEMPSGDKIAKYQIRLRGISYGVNVLATQIRGSKQEDYKLYQGAEVELQGVMATWESPTNGTIPVFNALEMNVIELDKTAKAIALGAKFYID